MKKTIFSIILITCILILFPQNGYAQPAFPSKSFVSDSTTNIAKISLHKTLFSGLKFSTQNNEPKNVFGFTGLSFTPEFSNIISTNPTALKEAEKSIPYNAIGLGGSIALVIFAMNDLLNTLNEADQVSSGNLPEGSSGSSLVPILISGGVMVVSSILANSHISKAVKIFNSTDKNTLPVEPAETEPFPVEKGQTYRGFKISLFGGVAFPQGDFGSTSGEEAGFANTGFCIATEAQQTLSSNLIWPSTLLVAFNSFDESSLQKQIEDYGGSISTGNYYTTWIMTGIGYETSINPATKIYFEGQIGLLLSSFPDITFFYETISITQTTKMATAFAYGFGGGIAFNKFNIGMRYYTAKPEYEQSASYGGDVYKAKVSLPASILQLMVGIYL